VPDTIHFAWAVSSGTSESSVALVRLVKRFTAFGGEWLLCGIMVLSPVAVVVHDMSA